MKLILWLLCWLSIGVVLALALSAILGWETEFRISLFCGMAFLTHWVFDAEMGALIGKANR
jgi:hypothetical protein